MFWSCSFRTSCKMFGSHLASFIVHIMQTQNQDRFIVTKTDNSEIEKEKLERLSTKTPMLTKIKPYYPFKGATNKLNL